MRGFFLAIWPLDHPIAKGAYADRRIFDVPLTPQYVGLAEYDYRRHQQNSGTNFSRASLDSRDGWAGGTTYRGERVRHGIRSPGTQGGAGALA